MTDVSNIYAKYHPALYKDFDVIEENVKKLTTNRTNLLILFLTNQIQRGSQCFENIRCQKGLKT